MTNDIRRIRFWSFAVLIFVLLYLWIGILTISEYGLTWDEGLGNVFFGQRYLFFLTSLHSEYLDFHNSGLSIHDREPDFSKSRFRHFPHEFPPFADTLSALTMELFCYRLNLVDPIEGFHIFTVTLVSAFLFFVFQFWKNIGSPFLGLISAVLIGGHPRVWADMHFNVKDLPEMVFFSLALFLAFLWFRRPSYRTAFLAGLVFSMALAVKANALFIPFIFIIGILPWRLTRRPHALVREHLRLHWKDYCLMVGAAVVSYCVLTVPFWLTDPERVVRYFSYIFSQGGRVAHLSWNLDPLVQTVVTIPITYLALSVIGICFALRKQNDDFTFPSTFVFTWLTITLVRSSLPGTVNFDGIRHFQEIVPPICFLAAYGAINLIQIGTKYCALKPRIVGIFVAVIVLVELGWIHTTWHPYQYVYYNPLVGGLEGAHERFDSATDYWGSTYRHGMQWLSENTTEESYLFTPIAGHIVDLTAPLYLRDGIQPIGKARMYDRSSLGRPVYVMFITRKNWYRIWPNYCTKHVVPVYEVAVEGTPIMQIFRLERLPKMPRIP